MSTKYTLETPDNVTELPLDWSTSEMKEFSLEDLGKYKLKYRIYVIINTHTQRVKVTRSYTTWLTELAALYAMSPDRTDISAFRVMRGFRPRFKSAMYVS